MRHLFSRLAGWAACGSILLTVACSGTGPADTRAADETAIRQADTASLQAIASKQLDATVSFYDEAASVFPPNGPIATGREAIRKAWTGMFAIPGFSLNAKTAKIEVARSGDIAYSQGTYDFAMNDAKGAAVTDRGKFVVVWKKQADGAWKIVADIWNSDLPVPAAK